MKRARRDPLSVSKNKLNEDFSGLESFESRHFSPLISIHSGISPILSPKPTKLTVCHLLSI